MIPVKVTNVSLSNVGFVVLLRNEQDPRSIPIFVGAAEAQAIAIQIDKLEVPRPLTHDLFKNVMDCLECRLKRVVVNDLTDNTFYAVMVLEHDRIETEMDARPSDAIALALRFGAPIFVVNKVLEQAGIVLDEKGKAAGKDAPPPASKPVSPLEALKRQLETAIGAEQYEEAARLRDEIKRVQQSGHAQN